MTVSPRGEAVGPSIACARTLLFGNCLDFLGWFGYALLFPQTRKRPADQPGEAILIPNMCCNGVTVRFRRGAIGPTMGLRKTSEIS